MAATQADIAESKLSGRAEIAAAQTLRSGGGTSQSNTGLPARGIVLIGTRATCRYLASQLAAAASDFAADSAGSIAVASGYITLDDLDTSAPVGMPASAAESFGVLPPRLGSAADLTGLHARYRFSLALICVPAGYGAARLKRLASMLQLLGITARWVPTARESLSGRMSGPAMAGGNGAAAIRPLLADQIDPELLIGRTGAGIDRESVARVITGKRVLITGAGGSIGSALAQIVASFAPESVILMERSENALFEIDQTMARRFAGVPRHAVLHDVVDAAATERLVARLKPQVVFHAAAHKHVPLMEDHPGRALENNLFGTASIALASAKAGAERFVLISTDKAVNPSSAMGASKRLAELFVAAQAKMGSTTLFSAVRFGNVLASACSVVPIWLRQVAEGVPLSVTDARMTRYFMTIPEAATLVVQAAALHDQQGCAPVFVLDMGKPIRIVELACRFARMHGAAPVLLHDGVANAGIEVLGGWETLEAALGIGEDGDAVAMPIALTGSRPGEKLHEELAYDKEVLAPTAHPKINRHVAPVTSGQPVASNVGLASEELLQALRPLCRHDAEPLDVARGMRAWVTRGG